MRYARALLITLEALGWLAWAWLLVRVTPFRRWARLLGAQGVITPQDALFLTAAQRVQRIKAALHRVGRVLPPLKNCLLQSIAGQIMLRRRHLPGTVYIGVVKQPGSPVLLDMGAHAWLRSGDIYVVSRLATPGLVELAYYGSEFT